VNSLPPGYALSEVSEQTVVLDPDHPGHVDFLVRALRSVGGRVFCSSGEIAWGDLRLKLDGKVIEHPFDVNGNYLVRDLTAGMHDVVVEYRSREYQRTVDLSAEPSSLRGQDVEVCTNSPVGGSGL